MAEIKTKASESSVQAFLEKIEDEKKRQDAFDLLQLMQDEIGDEGQMWGESIVGVGKTRYKYASGRENDWFIAGFSPRKQNFALYMMGLDTDDALLKDLGKHSTGQTCLYIKKLSDVDIPTLKKMVQKSMEWVEKSNAS